MKDRFRLLTIFLTGTLLLAACGRSTPVSQVLPPAIILTSPTSGQQVAEGQATTVAFIATDAQGVTRVELGVDGVLLYTATNPQPAPNAPFYGEWAWTPSGAGSHAVMAVAYNTASVASSPLLVNVTVTGSGGEAGPGQAGGSEGGGNQPTATWTPLAVDTQAPPSPPQATDTSQPPPPPPQPTDTSQPPPTAKPTAKPTSGGGGDSGRPAAPGLITDFETFGTWKRGDQPNGTFSQSAEQVHGGAYAGKLAYDFPSSGSDFVVFLQTHKLGGEPNQISAWVYGDGSKHYLNVWIKDAKGETWQFSLGQVKHTGWQQMTAWLDPTAPWPTAHIDGPSNNAVDYPIDFRGLALDDVPDSFVGKGTLYIDDLRCDKANQPQPTATTQPDAVSIRFWADRESLSKGQCTKLHWDVQNVREVYLDGQGVVGQGEREVCPTATTTYELRVILKNGSTERRTITLTVTNP
jgi:hypothetical protein